MSRRDRISDFTRPVQRNKVSDSRHVFSREQQNRIVDRHALPEKPLEKPTTPLREVNRVVARPNPLQSRQDKSKVLRRQGLQKKTTFVPRKKRSINYRKYTTIMAVSLVLLITPVVLYKFVFQGGFVKGVKEAYDVGDEQPKYLTSSSMMDVAAKVHPITSLDDQSHELKDASYAGWLEASSKPDTPGAMVMAGHTSGQNGRGAFHDIQALKKGDYIQVETGDGKVLLFRVHETRKYAPSDLETQEILKPIVADKQGLNLVSFTDKKYPESELGKYRFVVFAVKE